MIPRPWRKTGKVINCKVCGKEKYYNKYKLAHGRGKYCSKKCADFDFVGKHRNPSGEFKKGQRVSPKTQFKKNQLTGEKNNKWRGEKVGYRALHCWIRRHYGNAKKCERCSTKKSKRYEWANISKNYLRDITDWIQLCKKCHHAFDRNESWGVATRKFNL